jgi:RimJ/RimL family protein N-acetyltransferase
MAIIKETKNLILRNFEDKDLVSFIEYRSDKDVMRFQSWTSSPSQLETKKFISQQSQLKVDIKGEWIQIAFETKDSGTHIGDCAFIRNDKTAEVGITLAKQSQGKGYAVEGMKALLELLFNDLGVHRIIATIDVNNYSSIKLFEKLGFRKEGHFVESFFDQKTNSWADEYLYAILAKEFIC